MRLVLGALLLLAAAPLGAQYRGRDLFVPIVGRAVGHDGRAYGSAVQIYAPEGADVTVSYLAASQPNPSPRKQIHRLARGQSQLVDDFDGFGALRIEASKDVQADARFFSRKPGEPLRQGGTFYAMRAKAAIGIGDFARLPGTPGAGSRAKLYVVETNGHPLLFAATLLDARGEIVAEKRLYLAPNEPRAYDLGAEFPGKYGAALRLHGVNGDGRLLAVLSYIDNASAAATMHEMLRLSKPRHRFSTAEIATYVTATLGLIAVFAMRRR